MRSGHHRTQPDAAPVPGAYLDVTPHADGFEQNVEFLDLTYLDRDSVSFGRASELIAPLLWLKAGAASARIETVCGPWSLPADARYGLLFNAQEWRGFVEAVRDRSDGVPGLGLAGPSVVRTWTN